MRILSRAVAVGVLAGAALLVGVSGAGAQQYPPSGGCALALSSTVVSPGQTITASTVNCPNGYAPGSTVTLTFTSDPVTVATVTADAAGHFSTPVRIPSNATLGGHTITSTGPAAAGGTLTLSASLTVVAPGAAAQGRAGALAFTGSSDTMPLLWIGFAALVAGATLVVGAKRRAAVRTRQSRS
jgi:LPXTG-motif cell wall-anchored protein